MTYDQNSESFGAGLRRLHDELLDAYTRASERSGSMGDLYEVGLELSGFLRGELERGGDRDVAWLGEVAPASELLDRFEGSLRETYELALRGRRSAFDLKNVAGQFVGLAELAYEARGRGRRVPWVGRKKRR